MTTKEYLDWIESHNRLRQTRRRIVALFIVSLLGIPAPILGPIAGALAHGRRRELVGSDGTYLAMAYGAAALGAVYAIVIFLLWIGW